MILLFPSCDAPRYNPFDPNNENSTLNIFSGILQTESLPHKPLADVSLLRNGAVLGKTDNNGYFEINITDHKSGYITFDKSGFRIDSVFIDWGNNRKFSANYFLNQIPVVDSFVIFSTLISRYSLPATQKLNVVVKLTDKDNDIDSVFLDSGYLGFQKRLLYDANEKVFKDQYYTFDLNIEDLDEIIGVPFRLIIKSTGGEIYEKGNASLVRVIKSPIHVVSPANKDTVSSQPVLQWLEPDVSFNYEQSIQVFSNEIEFNPVLVWEKNKLSKDSISVKIDKVLPSGNYFWSIWLTDQYQNRISSNPASFYIK